MDIYKVFIRSLKKMGFNDDAVSSGKKYRKVNARRAKTIAKRVFMKHGVENN